MKSFLDHDRPDDEEEEDARADAPTDTSTVTKSNSPPPPTKASKDKSPDSTSKDLGLETETVSSATAGGSTSKDRAPSLGADTASSQAEISNSRANSSKAEPSSPPSTVAVMPRNSDAVAAEKPKPKLKIRLLGPNAANTKIAASNSSRHAPIDVAKVRGWLGINVMSHCPQPIWYSAPLDFTRRPKPVTSKANSFDTIQSVSSQGQELQRR